MAKTTEPDQHRMLLRAMANRLEGDFGELANRETLQHLVEDSYREMAERSKVKTHIPAFVERFARQRLKAIAKSTGPIEDHVPDVLFVCRRNDGVSQMAAALFNERAGGRARAHSAGTAPADQLLDVAVHAMHEAGVELLEAFPKPLTLEIERAADVIVTLDAHDDVLVIDGKQYQAWRLPDRHEEGLDGYRALRDDLRERVERLLERIAPSFPSATPHKAFDDDLAALDEELARFATWLGQLAGRVAASMGDGSAPPPDLDAAVAEAEHARLALSADAAALIARRQPVAVDLRHILALSEAGAHLERITRCFAGAASLLGAAAVDASPMVREQLAAVVADAGTMAEQAVASLLGADVGSARAVQDREGDLDGRRRAVFDALLTLGADGEVRDLVLAIDRASQLVARAADHAADIARSASDRATAADGERARRR